MFFQFSTTHHFFSFNCIILDRPKGKAVRNISAHTKRAPLAIRTLSPRVVSWFVAVFLRQPFQKGGFVTVLPRRPFCRISSRLATGHRLSRSGGYTRSLGSFTIIAALKMCAGNFAQWTRIFLIDKRKTPRDKHGTLFCPTPWMQLTKHPSCFTDYSRGLSATFISTGATSPTAGRTGYKRHSRHL